MDEWGARNKFKTRTLRTVGCGTRAPSWPQRVGGEECPTVCKKQSHGLPPAQPNRSWFEWETWWRMIARAGESAVN
jgi:hypothetical protein